MTAVVTPRAEAIAEAAARLNRALAEMHQLELAGGATAVAERSSGVRNGMSVAEAEAEYRALPREARERRAA